MLPSPLPWKCLLFLPLLSFSLQFSLILESLCLPGTHALSGNDVNRVKCFQGPRGRKTQCDFGEWLTSAEKHQEAKCSSSFLHRLVLCHTYSIRAAQVSGSLVYSLSSVRFFFCGVQRPGGSYHFLFSFLALPFLPLLSPGNPFVFSSPPRCLGSFTRFQIYSMSLNLPWGGRTLTRSISFFFFFFFYI